MLATCSNPGKGSMSCRIRWGIPARNEHNPIFPLRNTALYEWGKGGVAHYRALAEVGEENCYVDLCLRGWVVLVKPAPNFKPCEHFGSMLLLLLLTCSKVMRHVCISFSPPSSRVAPFSYCSPLTTTTV